MPEFVDHPVEDWFTPHVDHMSVFVLEHSSQHKCEGFGLCLGVCFGFGLQRDRALSTLQAPVLTQTS